MMTNYNALSDKDFEKFVAKDSKREGGLEEVFQQQGTQSSFGFDS